ncbi:hypothetical protein CEQ30_21445 [Nocardia brasiliensis]|uniref:CocE/NonD family hydrolase C-terminal non-catalytic domain-containing protein n=1 Tax=Nocardia brasiliensis TaxID=37326 RepID=UPI0009DECB7F|nr:hypothetical protein CEQ30_21445 [Nocardia brasiliensis]
MAVEDVAPDGTVRRLTEGSLTAQCGTRRGSVVANRRRHCLRRCPSEHLDLAAPLVPGQVTEFQVRVLPTAQKIDAGHRLRIRISSGNFPASMPHPSTCPGCSVPLSRWHTRPGIRRKSFCPLGVPRTAAGADQSRVPGASVLGAVRRCRVRIDCRYVGSKGRTGPRLSAINSLNIGPCGDWFRCRYGT